MHSIEINPSSQQIYIAKYIGQSAQKVITSEGNAAILGVTSKGVFIIKETGEVIFVSGDVFRGPITLNLERMLNFKMLFRVGDRCQILNGRLTFLGCQILLEKDTPIWKHPPIIIDRDGLSHAIKRGIELARTLIGGYQTGLFFAFLEKLINPSTGLIMDNLWGLITGKESHADPAGYLSGLMGLGVGLTPAGDDFICGFLLARYYLRERSPALLTKEHFYDQLVAEAQYKTTGLSAALIKYASLGEGDERLLNALQWISQGDRIISQARDAILSYGSSSGVDALAGMLSALLLQQEC